MNPAISERFRVGRGALADDYVGKLTHACLGQLLAAGKPIDSRAVSKAISAILPADTPPTYRQSLRQRVISAVEIYRVHFLKPKWQFLGREVVVHDVAFDLLWLSGEGQLVADELKTGTGGAGSAAHLAQCRSQAGAGNEEFGETFRGVRLVLLAERRAYWLLSGAEEFAEET